MEPDFLEYYNRELNFVRKMGGEFAKENSKVAGRLGLDAFECADPYVERLLEGFAFLTARVRLKMDAEFPRFTQHLLQMVYPHYLAPLPSMAIVQFNPFADEGDLQSGFTIDRGTELRSLIGKGEQTACEYRTAHDVTLWPIALAEAEYLANASAVGQWGLGQQKDTQAAIRIRLRTTAGLNFNDLALDQLCLYLRGAAAMQIYEQLAGQLVKVYCQSSAQPSTWRHPIEPSALAPMGFEDQHALLPYTARSFSGYRLLNEYFALPERYLFVRLENLAPAVRKCRGEEMDIFFLLQESNSMLADTLEASHLNLFCTPAVNLFPRRADRIHLSSRKASYHILPDRTRPMDMEIYDVAEVLGYGTGAEPETTFLPFYQVRDRMRHIQRNAYYTLYREQRQLSRKQKREGARSSYIGSEVYLSLVDSHQAPYDGQLKQVGLKLLCTNRDLPLHMPVGIQDTDFTIQTGAPVQSVRCLDGPTPPRPSNAHGHMAWQLISHLSLNYLSLIDHNPDEGAAALRQLLMLYSDSRRRSVQKQIQGIQSIQSRPVVRPIPDQNLLDFGRGLEITLRCDETAFEPGGIFLLGAVLSQFFARYVSINSFTETVVQKTDQGEYMRWPTQLGKRPAI